MTRSITSTDAASPIAERIGPVYGVEDVSRWLEGGLFSHEEVVSRAERRLLVAFRTDDRQWAFPAWSFEVADGCLEIRSDVVELWRQLPHDGFLTDVDLAAWMNTRFEQLDGTPAGYVIEHGVDELTDRAVSRLRSRVK